MRRSSPFAVVAVVLIAAACGGSEASAPFTPSQAGQIDLDAGPDARTKADGASGLPCDVDTVLANNCRKCHSDPPQFGAPFPLLTWDDLNAALPGNASKKVHQRVVEKIGDDANPMPPSPNPRLSASDRKVLEDWVAGGAAKDPVGCRVDPLPDGGPNLACTVNKTFAPDGAFEMPSDEDDLYVCWGVDITADTPTHIVGFAPRIDNTTITHHVVMYETSASYPSKPTPCSAGAALAWRMVLGWAPGVKGIELPKEAGFPVKSTGTHYVVQMHYSNVQHLAGQKDTSKIDVCTSPPRQYEADVVAFGTQNLKIPAAPPAGGVFTRNCTVKVPKALAGIHLFTAMPHMHKIGVSMSSTLERGATKIDLGTMPDFDFNSQTWLPIDAVTQEGDVIRTKCGYTNTTGKDVFFGEETDDEMCYSFTMYYPRISAPIWSWAAPTLDPEVGGATCVDEP